VLALHDVTSELFAMLKSWFEVPDVVELELSDVDSERVVREMSDPTMIAALAMRKLQALHLIATPGVRTSTDVVVTIVQDLARALIQAPNMRLQVAAASSDWDAELAALLGDGESAANELDDAPTEGSEADPETERFNELHGMLHVAVQATLEVSDGEIVYLE
jgi:hypothetical protein